MLAKMSDTNILYIDDIVGNQPDLCMEVSPRILLFEQLKKIFLKTLSFKLRLSFFSEIFLSNFRMLPNGTKLI